MNKEIELLEKVRTILDPVRFRGSGGYVDLCSIHAEVVDFLDAAEIQQKKVQYYGQAQRQVDQGHG